MRKQSVAERKADKRINAAYCANCSGVQVSVLDIGKVFKVGHQAIANGADDTELAARIVAFVETIRKN